MITSLYNTGLERGKKLFCLLQSILETLIKSTNHFHLHILSLIKERKVILKIYFGNLHKLEGKTCFRLSVIIYNYCHDIWDAKHNLLQKH